MINREQRTGFSRRIIWLLPHPTAPSPSHVRKLDRRRPGRLRKIDNLLTGKVGEGWRAGRSKSYDGEMPWSTINHSILNEFRDSPGEKNDQSIKPLSLTDALAA
jgi:hypothetical protein